MSPHEELFHRLLDESAARLAAPESAGIAIPDDELHSEIIVPLLPSMLGDKSIRQHWSEQAATGFPARLARHFENGDSAPRWLPGDFEIHVTASYSASADARALADTLLSEDSLRDMTAALMNQLLDVLWPSLAPAEPTPAVEIPPAEIPGAEITAPDKSEILALEFPAPEMAVQVLPSAIPPSAAELERAVEIVFTTHLRPTRALIRALCRKLPASVLQRGLVANNKHESVAASAAIVARRIRAMHPLLRIRQNARVRREASVVEDSACGV